ncbi:hypothetical protein [Tunturibacter empetritectus]|uniref:DUF4145 domain-containing protein n=1 Tax=Tunturiibacter lichenicola TaxID=2051959 RepID=A0A7W8J5T3_9BACT|nr:hypothetical protein [Edaphobacter lichenicola]MBB5343162.1 hypothetical protein [Edaphobacter lichenicola]
MTNSLTRRFDELVEQAKVLTDTAQRGKVQYADLSDRKVDGNAVLNWQAKAGSLVKLTCGEKSEHARLFQAASERSMYTSNIQMLERMLSVFEAAREDFKGGYLNSVRALVQAEVFSSELDQARELLDKGYLAPSAVIAGVVLETHLQELSQVNDIPAGKIEAMNVALAKKGIYNVLRQKQITAHADIRNKAAHGKANEFSVGDVKAMIEDIERFLAG